MVALILLFCLDVSDWISLFGIIINGAIGGWLIFVVQNKMTNNRVSKDYFINENNTLRKEYSYFFNSLYKSQYSSQKIIEWFKVMSINIKIYKETVDNEFVVNCDLLDLNNQLKKEFTDLNSFNESFKEKTYKLDESAKKIILKFHKEISKSIANNIISINKSGKVKKFGAGAFSKLLPHKKKKC